MFDQRNASIEAFNERLKRSKPLDFPLILRRSPGVCQQDARSVFIRSKHSVEA